MPFGQLPFAEVWVVDFKFGAEPGENPIPACLVAWELCSGRKLRRLNTEFGAEPPYSTGPNSLFVAYQAISEISCHLALGWPTPKRVLDLFTEFRNHTNGAPPLNGTSLLGALSYFGLHPAGSVQDSRIANPMLSGEPWSSDKKAAILDRCEGEVEATARLLQVLLAHVDLAPALLRGRYMVAAARVECHGVPIDTLTLGRLRSRWPDVLKRLVDEIDINYATYNGRKFKTDRFAAWLKRTNISWPRLKNGQLDLRDEAFDTMALAYPEVVPLRELRVILAKMRLSELTVGRDGRNRTALSAFRSTTGRNQPSSTKNIFGPCVWLRSLIQPPPGHGIAYVDWRQQEFGVAAALSHDGTMQNAYLSGDAYLEFAKQTGAVPANATKVGYMAVREQFKAAALGVQYGMGEVSLAQRITQPVFRARELLRLHRETYKVFWFWSDTMLDHAMLHGRLSTVFGWQIQVEATPNLRSLRNFPMQANAAEMLRLAASMATEKGIEVCALVHDALLICAPSHRLQAEIAGTREAMREASRIVLGGFELGTNAVAVHHPRRYMDERGRSMWRTIMAILEKIEDE
jgi:DNA polymerase I